jgi:hypothetical protein
VKLGLRDQKEKDTRVLKRERKRKKKKAAPNLPTGDKGIVKGMLKGDPRQELKQPVRARRHYCAATSSSDQPGKPGAFML